ncbi:MAG: cytochrome c3 family protein, partial [Planctomycetaceae bacterium]
RDSCTACHAPSAVDREGKLVGGVRFDCVECHGYHGLGSHSAVRDREGAY